MRTVLLLLPPLPLVFIFVAEMNVFVHEKIQL